MVYQEYTYETQREFLLIAGPKKRDFIPCAVKPSTSIFNEIYADYKTLYPASQRS